MSRVNYFKKNYRAKCLKKKILKQAHGGQFGLGQKRTEIIQTPEIYAWQTEVFTGLVTAITGIKCNKCLVVSPV